MSNADTFRKMMSYFADRNIEALRETIDQNVNSQGLGAAEVTIGFDRMMADFPETFKFDVEVADVHATGDRVSALVHVTTTNGERRIQYDIAEWVRYKNGKMVERRVYSNDTARIMDWFAQF